MYGLVSPRPQLSLILHSSVAIGMGMRTRKDNHPCSVTPASEAHCSSRRLSFRPWVVLCLLFAILPVFAAPPTTPPAPSVRIKKVLPHYLDKQGKHTLSPSLLERDAYQAELRASPKQRGGMQFDILVSTLPPANDLKLKLDARGSGDAGSTAVTLERSLAKQDRFHRWLVLKFSDADYAKLGNLTAWRATLVQGDTIISEQKSFLW